MIAHTKSNSASDPKTSVNGSLRKLTIRMKKRYDEGRTQPWQNVKIVK